MPRGFTGHFFAHNTNDRVFICVRFVAILKNMTVFLHFVLCRSNLLCSIERRRSVCYNHDEVTAHEKRI